ncbi:MAG: hypothetical protein JWP38_3364 [Herbaspirillum sp.]|jgi:hypothetical protein|nr:hypothetical protein [Herbaspirillum sp.]
MGDRSAAYATRPGPHYRYRRLSGNGRAATGSAGRTAGIAELQLRSPPPGDRPKRSAPAPLRFYSDTVLTRAYAEIHGLTPAQARKALQQADETLAAGWRDLRSIDDIRWTPGADDRQRNAHNLVHAATLLKNYMRDSPESDEAELKNAARMYLTTPPTTAIDDGILADIYHGVLQRRIDWIATDKVRAKGLSATHILQTVCRYRSIGIETRSGLDGRMRHSRDILIDEAALIAFDAQADGRAVRSDAPLHVIRAQYATALIDEWQDAWLGFHLLPSAPIPPTHHQFWFDGSVVRNARGKDLKAIADTLFAGAPYAPEKVTLQHIIENANRGRYLLGQPEGPIDARQRRTLTQQMHGDSATISRYEQRPGTVDVGGVWLTRDELRAVVEKTVRELALDTHYPGGTTLHAIATIVARLGPLHGVEFTRFDHPGELMQAFHRLNRRWHENPHYAAEPRLCAAHYLAQTGAVLFLDARSPLSESEQIAEQALADIQPAIRQAGGRSHAEDVFWKNMVSAFSQGRDPVIVPVEDKRVVYESVKARVTALRLAPEKIRYAGAADLHRQLNDYLQQRLLALAPLPVYDEDFLIEQILRLKLHMTDADLHTIRARDLGGHARFPPLPTTHIRRTTPIEEFKEKRSAFGREIRFKGRSIDPAREIAHAKDRLAVSLGDDPVILAKAKEIVRQHGSAIEEKEIELLRSSLAGGILGKPEPGQILKTLPFLDALFGSPTVSAIVTAIASGEPREILSLLPFVVPLYDIEEGIRLGDSERATQGAIHFGADAVLMAVSMGSDMLLRRQLAGAAESILLARGRMSPIERAGVDMMHEMAELFPEVSAEQMARRRTTIAEDAFDVRAQPDLPPAFRPGPLSSDASQLPAASASGLRTPDGRPLSMMYLEDENRPVPVRQIDMAFVETDLRGDLIVAAIPIFRNPMTGHGFRLGRRFGLPHGAAGVTLSDLTKRATVQAVKRYWQSVVTLPRIRVRRPDFKMLIDDLFEIAESSPVHVDFKKFWEKMYSLSDTAVVLLNSAFDKLRAHGCEVRFDADRAHVNGNRIHLVDDAALAQLNYLTPYGLQRIQRDRMWVHETTHWLTKLEDPPAHIAGNHRGGATFLTDRMLSELGSRPPIPPRVAYKTPARPETSVPAAENSDTQVWPKSIRKLSEWAVAEDNYLDGLLDVGRDFPPTLMVMGEKITKRFTVHQGVALAEFLRSFPMPDRDNPARLYQTIGAAFEPAALSQINRLALKTLIASSKTFRALAAAWSSIFQSTRIQIRELKINPENWAAGLGQPAHIVSGDGKTITLHQGPLFYFSRFDVTELPPLRQYAGAMIDLFVGDLIADMGSESFPNPHTNRGLPVLLENEVMRQIGDPSAPRICAALTGHPNFFLSNLATVNRAVTSENGYLQRICRGETPLWQLSDDDILGLSTRGGAAAAQ